MEIAIVGAGWFGCHLALALKKEHNITVFEKDEIFSGASGHNQNRLHLGFHYPRSYETRICAMEGYQEFVDIYSDLCETIDTNLYAIADKVSLIDYQTYLHIMDATGLSYEQVDPFDYGLENVSGCIKVDEKLVLTSKAKEFFSNQITPRHEVFSDEQVENFDVVLNCSSQVFQACKDWDLLYEPCLMLNYKCSVDFPAVTIMDGALCTVYPKEDDVYTLYSVEHSPQREMSTYYGLSKQEATAGHIKKFEGVVETYIPHFKDVFEYCGYENSLRVSFNDNTDLRVPKIAVNGKVIHVLPSKIDNIFYAEREIKKLLQS
jgi:L-2-hydroxyglutarate oxidase LhgO